MLFAEPITVAIAKGYFVPPELRQCEAIFFSAVGWAERSEAQQQ